MMPTGPHQGVWARWGLDPRAGLIDGILIESALGRVTRVESCRNPPPDLPENRCWRQGLITPGLLNAHAHLDYSWLAGKMPRRGFVEWLGAMIAARRTFDEKTAADARAACALAIEQSVARGITSIWDIGGLGIARPLLEASGLSAISFMEMIAPSRAAWEEDGRARLAQSKMASYITPPVGSLKLGISPHSTYTVIPEALEACAHWANRRGAPMAIHLAESPEENELLMNGGGDLAVLFENIGGGRTTEEFGTGVSPIERARRAGALQPNSLAIHCNLPQPGEAAWLARSGAGVVFCPLSHAWFDFPPYPLDEYREIGVQMAIGTDSLASNCQLDIRMEAAEIARRYRPEDPLWLLSLATGAALGSQPPYGGLGVFAEGQRENWAVWETPGFPPHPTPEKMMECWLDPATRCVGSSVTTA